MTPEFKKTLTAKAHHLKPVVMIGAKGLTEAVLAEMEQALFAHELIKIRISAEREERAEIAKAILEHFPTAEKIQTIGHILVLYQARPEA